MSWQAYVDSNLVGAHSTIDKAAIFSSAGDSKWASSAGFEPTADEMKTIAGLFSKPDSAFGEGFHVAKEKYVTIKADDRSLYGKQGKTGIVLVKTKQAILIGHYADGGIAGSVATTVEKLADYLISTGY